MSSPTEIVTSPSAEASLAQMSSGKRTRKAGGGGVSAALGATGTVPLGRGMVVGEERCFAG